MGSPWYKIMLGMSYYIHAGGLGALKALPGSVSKRVTPVAVIVLPQHVQAWDLGMSTVHAQHARAHLSRIAGAAAVPGTSTETICSFAAIAAASWRMPLAGAVVCAERSRQPLFSALSA